jgi:hypothetical protein
MSSDDRWIYVQAWAVGIAMLASVAVVIVGWF